MRSATIPRARTSARRASATTTAHVLARAGLTARGIIYILIGWVAVLVALGRGSHEADQQGALQLLAGRPYGARPAVRDLSIEVHPRSVTICIPA